MDITKLENLSSHESRKYSLKRKSENNSYKTPWTFNDKLAYRILKKYLNKSFNDANSEFCKRKKVEDDTTLLDKIERSVLLSDFVKKYTVTYHVDDEGIIRSTKKAIKKLYVIDSWDLVYEWITLENGINKRKAIKGEIFEFEYKDHRYWKEYYRQRALKRKAKRNKLKNENS
ncbi:MAG TPA: hypothetical protein PKD00_01340 [Burkholderiales bacterium]|nr:hypothetical protein [Burkholderiales bacterium]